MYINRIKSPLVLWNVSGDTNRNCFLCLKKA